MSERFSLRILVLENHPDTLLSLTYYLRQHGHVVRCATTVAEAAQALRLEPVDVLLSDIGLPDGDGRTLLRSLDAARPFAIAMSGLGSSQDFEQSLAAGFSHHLVKPFDPEELDRLLREAALALLARQ